jgi:hypothetical protein
VGYFMSISSKRFLLLVALCGGLVRCGDAGKSSKVKVTAIPSNPIIITGDGKDADGNPLTAPWFSYRLFLENGSDEAVSIVAIKMTITLSETGASPSEASFTASLLNYTVGTDESFSCAYYTVGEFAKGASGYMVGKLTDPTLGPEPVPAIHSPPWAGVCDEDRAFAITPNSLTKPRDPRSKNYRYRVEIEPQGWFGDRDHANDRFDKKIVIYTR